jgi:hypothetical protein
MFIRNLNGRSDTSLPEPQKGDIPLSRQFFLQNPMTPG